MRLNDAASGTGRSLNKEIVDRLEQSFSAAPEAAPVGVNGEDYMRIFRRKRTALVLAATVAVLAAVLAGLVTTSRTHSASPQASVAIKLAGKELQRSSQGGVANGGGGGESADLFAAQQQWDNTRTAPGIVAPGAYSAAFASLQGLSATAGSWNEVTRVPYDADDPDYRDYYSNSSGGCGPRHRPRHRARDRQGRRRLRRRRRRRRLALDHGPRQLGADRGQPAVSLLGRPEARRLRSALVRHGRGEHRRHLVRRQRRLPPRQPGDRHVLGVEPHRRHRAREHDHPSPPLLGRHRLCGDAARRLLALGQRPGVDAVEAALRAQPVLPAGRRRLRRAERRLPEHRQRPGGRPEGREAPDRGRGLARGCGVQRLLRVEGRRRNVDEDQPGRRDQPEGHRLRDVRVRG